MSAEAANQVQGTSRLNVLISGSSLSSNKGAMAMTIVAVERIRRMFPGSRVRLLSKYYRQDEAPSEEYGVELVHARPSMVITSTLLRSLACMILRPLSIRWLYDSVIKAYAESDIVVDLGGVTFSDDRDWKGLMLSIGWAAPAAATGTPFVKLSQAIGPFRKKRVRWPAKFFLKRCGLLIARGKETAANVRNLLGPGKKCCECADVAFLLEPAEEDVVDRYLVKNGLPSRMFVGLSPSAVVDRKARAKGIRGRYRCAMTGLIEHSRRVTGLPVVMVPHAWPQTGRGREDVELCRDIYDQLDDKRNVFMVTENTDARILKGIVARSEVFAACRFHAMIAALSSSVPTLVVGWGHKYTEVMRMFGMEGYSCDFTTVRQEELYRSFSRLWSDRGQLRRQVSENLGAVTESAAENFRLLGEFVHAKELL